MNLQLHLASKLSTVEGVAPQGDSRSARVWPKSKPADCRFSYCGYQRLVAILRSCFSLMCIGVALVFALQLWFID